MRGWGEEKKTIVMWVTKTTWREKKKTSEGVIRIGRVGESRNDIIVDSERVGV